MINDEELMARIETALSEYSGQVDDFYSAVGMIVVGRLLGWRVMRLVAPIRIWSVAIKTFGDPKLLMPDRGKYAYKSVGLLLADKLGGYWDMIRGSKPSIPMRDRKMVK
jgi:hypothetical protein